MNIALFRFINQTIKSPFLDWLLPLFSDKDFVVIPGVVVFLVALYFGSRRLRVCLLAIIAAVAVSNFGSEKLIKNIVREPRPYTALDGVNVYRSGEWAVYTPEFRQRDKRHSYAFPSSHAANIAAAAIVLAFLRRRSLYATIPLALFVGISRIYTGNHFPDAVFWGYVWGAICGLAMTVAIPRVVKRVWGSEPAPALATPMAPERKAFLWLLGLWTLVNFCFVCINRFTLAGDEAQYWDWSRHLALGYYSKPPMIAYIIHVLTKAGGSHGWAIRSGAVLFSSASLALVYALTLRIARGTARVNPERTALLAACIALAMPASWVSAVLMTIDAPAIFFWALAMYCFHCAVNDGRKYMWALTGLALGLGALTKYTVFLLLISFALYLVFADRRWLRTPGPYLAVAIMLVCLSGVVYWNATHDWVSVKHTASINAGGGKSVGNTIGHLLDFAGGQAGLVVSPVIFALYLWAMAGLAKRFRASRDAAYVFLCFAVLFGFYVLVACTRKTMANWPAAAYVAAVPALAWVWEEQTRSPRARALMTAGILLGCALGIATRSSDLIYIAAKPFTTPANHARIHIGPFSLDPDKDPTNKILGGRELGNALSHYLSDDKTKNPFIFSNAYQMNAVAAFYTKGRPRTYCMNPGDRRYNQYDLWGGWEGLAGQDGLFITGGDETRAHGFIDGMVRAGAFDKGEFLETVKVWRGKTLVRTFTISKLYRYSGIQMPQQDKF